MGEPDSSYNERVAKPSTLLDFVMSEADSLGVKLEMVEGVPVWELFPGPRHQMLIDQIRSSIRKSNSSGGSGCGCFHLSDVHFLFADGSFKRPDIAILCEKPPMTDKALTQIPKAVIEILSQGYEAKDLKFGVPFYLKNGVQDVIVFDPGSLTVQHHSMGKVQKHKSPVEIELACGCACTV